MAKRDHRKGALPFKFVAIPVPVLESPEYRALPDAARALLIDLLMQFTGKNNGRVSTSFVALQRYGWTSKSKLERAKAALLQAPFVLVTRRGRPPNTTEWVGVTWLPLDFDRTMDVDPRSWPYMNFQTIEAGAIDPNHGRAKQFGRPRIRGDGKALPRGIAPESGVMT
ncbi:hypothetical protein V8Z80_04845 [Orrella sp. JC864]|uniref:hypothetical protein n=1 Tax=Orrella sp. JC864 TaxID=3120298 RepID=UPI00300AB51A